MGIYTNYSGSNISSNYTQVEPFVGENFNYHELGIRAASEIAANHNSFMKSIALSELAAFEQTGSTDVLYEAVDIKGIFEKIKMFFKKIIEKIHKIFHTFIARMSAWFGGNASFAKTYEKEVVKGWGNVKNDWEFKGYHFTHISETKADTDSKFSVMIEGDGGTEQGIKKKLTTLIANGLAEFITNSSAEELKALLSNDTGDKNKNDTAITAVREKMDDIKDAMRFSIVKSIRDGNGLPTTIQADFSGSKYDSSEYTEELFKVYRNEEDSKESFEKKDVLASYGGSVAGMMTYIKEFDKIKTKTESAERKITKAINKLIDDVSKAQNASIKEMKDDKSKTTLNEYLVQMSSLYQTIYSAASEYVTQAFSAYLQAQKEACTQAKEIAVKVIGQSKKMTESYDYSSEETYNNGFDFISSVKLI